MLYLVHEGVLLGIGEYSARDTCEAGIACLSQITNYLLRYGMPS